MSTKSIEDRMQKALEAEAKAKQRVRALQAAVAGVERKRDTKRKILLGAWLIENKPEVIERIVAGLTRESDREAFAGWKPPVKAAPVQEQKGPQETPVARPAAPVTPPMGGVMGGVLRRPMGG